MKTILVVLIALVALSVYLRLTPVRPSAKHDVPEVDADTKTEGGFTAVRPLTGDPDDVLARLTQIALTTPRTTQLTDDPLRFVTRSRLMAFPDITTVLIKDDNLVISAHLTIGRNDIGVNQARVLAWLDELGPL